MLIQISPTVVSSDPIYNMLALAKFMDWHQTGDKPLSNDDQVQWYIYAQSGVNGLN